MKFIWVLFLFPSLLLISCYPKKKILARWSNGQPKVVRHYKLKDSTNEKLVTYYENGKKESVEYWNNGWQPSYKWKEWYKTGKLEFKHLTKYKDTTTAFNPRDSSCTFSGLVKKYEWTWAESGKLWTERYSKNGQIIDIYNYGKGDSLRMHVIKNVRPDGYDTISINHK